MHIHEDVYCSADTDPPSPIGRPPPPKKKKKIQTTVPYSAHVQEVTAVKTFKSRQAYRVVFKQCKLLSKHKRWRT